MANSTRNVIVGAANLFISNKNGDSRPDTKAATITTLLGSGQSARSNLNSGTDYREVGYTSTGIEISYEPNYGEVMVDQLLDAARLFKQTLKVILKTELVEATLENLTLSWGQSDFYINPATGDPVWSLTNTGTSSTYRSDLNLAAGAVGDTPVERVLIAVGSSSRQVGSSYDPSSSGGTGAAVSPLHTSDLKQKERVYVARRVVSIDTTAHGLKRDAATVFPVNFRCLPDDTQAEYAGTEYGVVIDRLWGTI